MAYFNGWFKAANSEQPEENNYSGYAYFVGGQILLCSLIGACFTRLPMYFPCSWRKKRLSSEEAPEREKTLDLYMSQHAPTRRLRTGFAIVVATLIFSTTVDHHGVREYFPRGLLGDLDRSGTVGGIFFRNCDAVPVLGPLHARVSHAYGGHRDREDDHGAGA
ncbi:hypothetical protein C4B63_301g1 [Trypanosoma cruzi]|uniref:Uncharacterized protein n=1 Tax=Trypanosoma cruzi TaxID=5693 RepID=A0A2V2UI28_TRYCR|nr:hypothetical protein C4B63_301g1 [Trypanosoma cruzi]